MIGVMACWLVISPPFPHFVRERTETRLNARPLHPERGERWFAKQTGEGGNSSRNGRSRTVSR